MRSTKQENYRRLIRNLRKGQPAKLKIGQHLADRTEEVEIQLPPKDVAYRILMERSAQIKAGEAESLASQIERARSTVSAWPEWKKAFRRKALEIKRRLNDGSE